MNLSFIGKGMNPVLCQWIVLILRFGLIALGLYVGFWVALAILAVWVVVGAAEVGLFSGSTSDDESDSGMRSGMSGFGYYMGEFRVDGARLDEEDWGLVMVGTGGHWELSCCCWVGRACQGVGVWAVGKLE